MAECALWTQANYATQGMQGVPRQGGIYLKAGLADDARVGRAERGGAPDDAPARRDLPRQHRRQRARGRQVLPVHVVHQDHLRAQEGACRPQRFALAAAPNGAASYR